jgi:hypothetical protein
MWHRFTVWALLLAGIVCLTQVPTRAYWQTRDSAYNNPPSSGAGGSCSQSTAYFAAATTLTGGEKTALDTLICGRVTSGVFAKLDVWNFLALTNKADALINMAQPGTFNTTEISTPTFTANRGYTGVDASTTIALDTNFNPSTAGGHYTQNSAHLAFWSNTSNSPAPSNEVDMGLIDVATPVASYISAGLSAASAGNSSYTANANAFASGATPSGNSLGHFLANRTNLTADLGYWNAADQMIMGKGSAAPTNGNFYVLAYNVPGTGVGGGSARQIMTFSIGGGLSGADITDLCHATNVALTALGGVSGGIC